MQFEDVMQQLAARGTAQNRKIYARHGATEPMFGVSFADLYKLQKSIGVDHALAWQLWGTGNHDARVLATLVADGGRFTAAEVKRWQKGIDNHVLGDALAKVAAKGPAALAAGLQCIARKDEWTSVFGWLLLASAVGDAALADQEFAALLPQIVATLQKAPNYTRHAMNSCVIAIGCRPSLRAQALAAAKRIGVVTVDHGQTSCKTPDAADYILKIAAREKVRIGKVKVQPAAKAASQPTSKSARKAKQTGAAAKARGRR